jgi:hypothetical protein
MKGITTSVLIRGYVVGVAINLEGRVLDAVGVTSWDTAGNLSAIDLDSRKMILARNEGEACLQCSRWHCPNQERYHARYRERL